MGGRAKAHSGVPSRWPRWTDVFSKHVCPLCGRRGGRYLPLLERSPELGRLYQAHGIDPDILNDFGTLNVQAYACPRCKASDRDQLYALYLLPLLENSPAGRPIRIVEFGPSKSLGPFLRRRPNVEYRSADLFKPNVDDTVDIQNMECYEDGRFDILICSHVLEHVPDDLRAMRELRRILRPGGCAILMVPILTTCKHTDEDPTLESPADRLRRFLQADHIRL